MDNERIWHQFYKVQERGGVPLRLNIGGCRRIDAGV
jgi:hypothetical protein